MTVKSPPSKYPAVTQFQIGMPAAWKNFGDDGVVAPARLGLDRGDDWSPRGHEARVACEDRVRQAGVGGEVVAAHAGVLEGTDQAFPLSHRARLVESDGRASPCWRTSSLRWRPSASIRT